MFDAMIVYFAGLLALTVGFGDNAREILDESVTPISQALKAGSESLKTEAVCMIFNISVGLEFSCLPTFSCHYFHMFYS